MRQIVGHDFGGIIPIRNEKFQKLIFFSIFLKKFFLVFKIFFNFLTVLCFEFLKNGLVLNILFDLYTGNCPKIKKRGKKIFKKN